MKHTIRNWKEKWSDFKWAVFVGKYDAYFEFGLFLIVLAMLFAILYGITK